MTYTTDTKQSNIIRETISTAVLLSFIDAGLGKNMISTPSTTDSTTVYCFDNWTKGGNLSMPIIIDIYIYIYVYIYLVYNILVYTSYICDASFVQKNTIEHE